MEIPSARAFQAIRSVSVSELSGVREEDLRPLLPCLVRMALCSPVDESAKWTEARKEVQKLLSGLEVVNAIVALLSVDFSLLEQDALKEQQLRRKVGGSATSSVLIESLQNGLALEFERSEPSRRLRLVLSELLRIMSKVDVREEFIPEKCELFESEVYLEEVSDVICIAQAELPSLLALNQLAEALLRVKHGPWLLCRLVANAPDSFEQVCTSLLERGEVQDEGGLGGMVRTQALRQLCAMNPSSALVVHSEALRLCRMPGLAVALILDFGVDSSGSLNSSDLVAFLSGLLLGGDTKARNWFSSFVRIGQKSNTSILSSLRSQLLKEMSSLVPSGIKKGKKTQSSKADVTVQETVPEHDEETLEILQAMEVSTDYELTEESSSTQQINMDIVETVEILDEDVIQGTALLRLYCALKRLAGMKLTQQEAEALLRLVTCHPPPTAAGVRFVVVGLCTLLVCTNIMSSPEHEQIATQWIKWLSKEEAHYEAASGVQASFGEILLLIAIHFHASQVEAIADLVCSVLGMNIRLGSLTRMKTLFTQDIFPEKVVTAHAVTVPVTPQLSSDDAGFLPVHCVHQLLRSRAFTKHAVPVKDWVYKQICCCTTPLHPLVVPLLEAFVHSVINPVSNSKSARNKETAFVLHGFTDAEVMSVFAADQQEGGTAFRIHGLPLGPMRRSSVYVATEMSSHLTSQILMLYYVLTYQDCLLSNMKSLVSNNIQPQWLSPMLLSQIPIKHLLEQARSRRQEFRGLYAPLLQLINTHLPHLCLVDDWLRQEEVFTAPDLSAGSPLPNVQCSPSRLQEALCLLPDNPCPALLLLRRLLQLEPSALIAYMDVLVRALPSLLEPGVPRRVQTLCCELWTKINTVVPRKLWLATVNTLCPAETPVPHLTPQLYTDEDIMKDPLTVLRCDRRVFRCPPLFDVLVRVLMGYLAGSRALLSQYLQAHPASRTEGMAVEQEREELRAALVTAQESAAIQILLEVCVKTPHDQDQPGCSGSGVLREIQCRVCSQLHQMFIAVPEIAKLVHFQGYPVELLPVTVAGIPSMHICLDFIPELVNQPQLEKQLFAIQLASYLCLQFPLPKAMGVARYILSRLSSLLATLPASKRGPFFTPTLPTLVRFCRAFPPLCDEATGFLLELGRVAASHASASAGFTLGTPGSLLHQLSSQQQQETSDQEDHGFTDDSWLSNNFKFENEKSVLDNQADTTNIGLCQEIEKTFLDLTKVAVVRQHNCEC
ncbi:Integrator complex subunit 2 [Desmophyllum pertusum]|uniref:Integrator complex subunit 2 n=1 Tax=Desmophyllum pertusum TaxID=174260 RepID=A0A9W9Z2H4_9CNID|nr:Integrator complex subunit 2 [Desmophyllum pertusum]